MKKILFTITVLVLIAAFGISAFMVGSYIVESKQQKDMYAQLAAQATAATEAPTLPPETTEATEAPTVPETTEATEPTEPQILPEMLPYYEANNDTVAYIKIEGTKVDNPVVQTMDNRDYYLKRDFQGNNSEWGTIYAELADINKPSDNVTLYGHNMRDGSMFHDLLSYENKEVWEENKLIFFNTLYERHTYKIFAVFKTSADLGQGFSYHKFIDAANEEEFNEFVETCKELSFYDTGITPVYGDKLLTLSTCEYTLGNGRFVVCAVRWT